MRRLRPSLTTVMQDERGQTLGRCGEVLRAHRVLGLGEEGLGRLGGGQSQQDREFGGYSCPEMGSSCVPSSTTLPRPAEFLSPDRDQPSEGLAGVA